MGVRNQKDLDPGLSWTAGVNAILRNDLRPLQRVFPDLCGGTPTRVSGYKQVWWWRGVNVGIFSIGAPITLTRTQLGRNAS